MSAAEPAAARLDAEVAWHDVENGAYAADLALWDQLVSEAAGPVLELGAGTGRVALRLAAAGHDVTAIDSSGELIAELVRRSRERRLSVVAEIGDVRRLALGRRFAAIIAPMQIVQVLGAEDDRAATLRSCAGHLAEGGVLAVALLAEDALTELSRVPEGPGPLPDVREVGGWVYSSLPVDVRIDERSIEVRRLRQVVSPTGDRAEREARIELERVSADRLEAEANDAGLQPRERIEIPATDDHVGSIVCVLEAAR